MQEGEEGGEERSGGDGDGLGDEKQNGSNINGGLGSNHDSGSSVPRDHGRIISDARRTRMRGERYCCIGEVPTGGHG